MRANGRTDGIAIARDDIDDARWKPGLLNHGAHPKRRQRREFRWLERVSALLTGKNTLKQTFKTRVFPVASARIFMLSLYLRDEDMSTRSDFPHKHQY
jgi:hypothetical protein